MIRASKNRNLRFSEFLGDLVKVTGKQRSQDWNQPCDFGPDSSPQGEKKPLASLALGEGVSGCSGQGALGLVKMQIPSGSLGGA